MLKYLSGEEIRTGDRVRLHAEPGEIEFVATDANDPELAWYVQEHGLRSDDFGSRGRCTCVPADQIAEDVEFVARFATETT